MREFKEKIQDKTGIVAEKQQEKKTVLIGRLRPCRGHKCYQLDTATGIITEAVYEEQTVDFVKAAKGDLSLRRKLIISEGCVYTTALNKTNAAKKFLKMIA